MTESMREAFEKQFPVPESVYWNSRFGYLPVSNEYKWSAEAQEHSYDGWVAASTQPQQWIKCSDRLPTEQDVDPQNNIWISLGDDVWLFDLVDLHTLGGKVVELSWMRTNLERPEPPKE